MTGRDIEFNEEMREKRDKYLYAPQPAAGPGRIACHSAATIRQIRQSPPALRPQPSNIP